MNILNRRGNVLLFVISGIAMAAAIGMGMFYMTSTTSMGQMTGNAMDRAHYLAVAGKNYALANWKNRTSWNNVEFSVSDKEKFILSYSGDEITSTGIVNKDTALEARKEIKAKSPSPIFAKKEWKDTFENLDSWDTGTQVGEHTIATVSGDKALQVTNSVSLGSYGRWSFLQFNPSGAGIDLNALWLNAGRCLSYDLQVKIANDHEYWRSCAAGLIFKVAGTEYNRDFYGATYIRARQKLDVSRWVWESDDDIPDGLKPTTTGSDGIFKEPLDIIYLGGNWYRYSRPAIVLWKKQGSDLTWLTYKLLTNTDHVVDANNRLVDWSNLQVRLIEAYPLNFSNGGPKPLLYGTTIVGATSGAKARINGTPILTAETWSSSSASGTLTLDSISGTFQSGEKLLVDDEVRARSSGTLGTKSNFIRVYYGDVNSHGTPSSNPTDNDRLGNPRLVYGSGDIIHWPVDNINSWGATNDYMTLVQWETPNATAIPVPDRLGGGETTEAYSIIKDDSLRTPDSGTINYSGIALHATGDTATSTYFDDFAIQY